MATDVIKAAYNRKEAAAYPGIAENTFVKLLNSGRVKHVKAGRRLIIPKRELDKFLEIQ